MKPFTVALLQMAGCAWNRDESLAKGEAFCRQAGELGADLALFPEMWQVGYVIPEVGDRESYSQWEGLAAGLDDPYVAHFGSLARELRLAIALTYLERWPGAPRNAVTLFDRTGEPLMTYAKVHTCRFDRERLLTPGDSFPVATLETAAGPVRVGAMICFDREFPESARLLMLGGAEIILIPNACEQESHRIAQLETRAFENMVGVALANYARPQNNGRSMAFDGMAFSPDGTPREMKIVEAGEGEEVALARFDLDALRAYREREVWGDAHRRPQLYRPLAEEQDRRSGGTGDGT